MKGIVERFEEQYVVIEINGEAKDFKKEAVDPQVKVGDFVCLINSIWVTDKLETKEREMKIKKLMDEVWEDE